MQLQRLHIMDVCSLNPKHFAPDTTLHLLQTTSQRSNSLCQRCWLPPPPTHPPTPQLPNVSHIHTRELKQVGGKHFTWKTSWVQWTKDVSSLLSPLRCLWARHVSPTAPVGVAHLHQLKFLWKEIGMPQYLRSAWSLRIKYDLGWSWEQSRDLGCGCSGRNRDRAEEEGRDNTGTKARQRGMGLGRDVVRTELRPTTPREAAKKYIFLNYLSMSLALFSENTCYNYFFDVVSSSFWEFPLKNTALKKMGPFYLTPLHYRKNKYDFHGS